MNTITSSTGHGIPIKTVFPPFGKPKKVSPLIEVMRHDPESYHLMLQYIKQGAYPWVVFESLGIASVTYRKWYRRGREEVTEILDNFDEENPPKEEVEVSAYGQLFIDIMKATGQARLFREIAVAEKNPEKWLTQGPGRSRPDEPGWTEESQNININAQINAEMTIQEEYSRAPTDAETLGEALKHLHKYLPGGLPALLEYTQKDVVDSKFSPENNGKDQ